MAAIVSREPALFIAGKETIIHMENSILRKTPLREAVQGAGEHVRVAERVASRLLAKATELSISASLGEVRREEDAEVPGWSYAVVPLRISVSGDLFQPVEWLLVREAYRGLRPEEALKVVVEAERV